jgi:hypothetical protein
MYGGIYQSWVHEMIVVDFVVFLHWVLHGQEPELPGSAGISNSDFAIQVQTKAVQEG